MPGCWIASHSINRITLASTTLAGGRSSKRLIRRADPPQTWCVKLDLENEDVLLIGGLPVRSSPERSSSRSGRAAFETARLGSLLPFRFLSLLHCPLKLTNKILNVISISPSHMCSHRLESLDPFLKVAVTVCIFCHILAKALKHRHQRVVEPLVHIAVLLGYRGAHLHIIKLQLGNKVGIVLEQLRVLGHDLPCTT